LAAYRYLLNRLYQLPLSQDKKQQEMKTIHQIAKNNGYPKTIIENLNKHNKQKSKHNTKQLKTKQQKMGNIRIS
jgi:SOS-response transcriptional repressor LexA